MNCGYNAIRYLLKLYDINDFSYLDAYQNIEEMSFYDFYKICLAYKIKSNAYCIKKINNVPCIVQIKIGTHNHFVVVLKYDMIVTYIDTDNRKHYLLKIIFNILFTGNIFLIGCVKSD